MHGCISLSIFFQSIRLCLLFRHPYRKNAIGWQPQSIFVLEVEVSFVDVKASQFCSGFVGNIFVMIFHVVNEAIFKIVLISLVWLPSVASLFWLRVDIVFVVVADLNDFLRLP